MLISISVPSDWEQVKHTKEYENLVALGLSTWVIHYRFDHNLFHHFDNVLV